MEVALGAEELREVATEEALPEEYFIQKTIQGGRRHAILTYPHSTVVNAIGVGGSLVTSVKSQLLALGETTLLRKTTEPGTSLQKLTQNRFTICYTTPKFKKYKMPHIYFIKRRVFQALKL